MEMTDIGRPIRGRLVAALHGRASTLPRHLLTCIASALLNRRALADSYFVLADALAEASREAFLETEPPQIALAMDLAAIADIVRTFGATRVRSEAETVSPTEVARRLLVNLEAPSGEMPWTEGNAQ